jgi:uncharacterized protein
MDFVVRLVDACRRHARLVALVFLALTLGCLAYTAHGIRMDTDTDTLLSAELPWKKAEADYDRSFPQKQRLLVAVIDAATPDRADAAAAGLTAKLLERPDLFHHVRRADPPFLRRNGFLYMDTPELTALAGRLTEAQPLIGSLAADPTPRGLFHVLALVLEGAKRGQFELEQMAPLFDGLAKTADTAAAGKPEPLSWYTLFTGKVPGPRELRRYVLFQPADGSTGAARAAVAALGADARIRLTGNVAMEEEEFRSVAEGTEVSGLVSFALVAVLLVLALRSWRLIAPILLTLVAGLAATFAFAVAAVGTLNSISIAFAVLFIGMAVDFGIQVATRYRDRRFVHPEPRDALLATARGIAGPLLLAAATTAVGFLAFLPTDFDGVSQLGLIAGAGMAIAAAFNLTLLPALLVLFRPAAEADPVGYPWLAPADRFFARHARAVTAAALLLAALSALALPGVRFDFNPLNLRDPRTEAVGTAFELMNDRDTTPFTAQVMTASPAEAAVMAQRLKTLPQVARALTINSFVPEDQEAKLAILADLNLFLGPVLLPVAAPPPATPAETRAALAEVVEQLKGLPGARAAALARSLEAVMRRDEATFAAFGTALTGGLKDQLDALAELLAAEPVTLASIPADFAADWVTADGRARVEAVPAGDARDPAVLVDFVDAVQSVAPQATGTAVTIQESARVIVGAFREAGLVALAAIVLVLGLVLRRAADVLLVLAPLALSTLVTAGLLVAGGLSLNFANIIALPLLMGVGVAFAIYFVVNARAGETRPLQSSTTRAVFYSAATTAVSFGSLGLSAHLGTASMGILLSVGLVVSLAATLTLLPALLALTQKRPGTR